MIFYPAAIGAGIIAIVALALAVVPAEANRAPQTVMCWSHAAMPMTWKAHNAFIPYVETTNFTFKDLDTGNNVMVVNMPCVVVKP